MSEKREQVKPLAPAAHRIHVDDHSDAFSVELASYNCRRRQRCIKICGCSAAVILIMVTIILVLMFTVFHVKVPVLRMDAVSVKGVGDLNSVNGTGRNVTFDLDVSVKNPNVASFKFSNTTTYVYYDGAVIGEATGPPGSARARRRTEIDVSVGVMVDDIMRIGRLKRDLEGGILRMSSFTRISGKVRITRVIKRSLVLKLNCTINVNIVSQGLEDFNCS